MNPLVLQKRACFISLVQDKIKIEKYIAATLNGEREFQQKWKFLLTIILRRFPLQFVASFLFVCMFVVVVVFLSLIK